jgi:hypothetical protein
MGHVARHHIYIDLQFRRALPRALALPLTLAHRPLPTRVGTPVRALGLRDGVLRWTRVWRCFWCCVVAVQFDGDELEGGVVAWHHT